MKFFTKFSKTSFLALVIGIYVIIFAGLGIFHLQQMHQQNKLLEDSVVAQKKLEAFPTDQLYSRKSDLEKQLKQTETQYEAVKDVFSRPVKSVAASNILFNTAEACNLEVTDISSARPSTDSEFGIDCSVISLTATVEGDVTGLVNFIVKLNGQMATDILRSITITFPDPVTGDRASADVHLFIYTYQGD
jgi:hypothetical protein